MELRISPDSESAPLSGRSGRRGNRSGSGLGVDGDASIFAAYAAVAQRRRTRARAAAIGRPAAALRPAAAPKARAANPFAVKRCVTAVAAEQASAPHAHYLARPKRAPLALKARPAAAPVLQPGAVAVAFVSSADDAGAAGAATKTPSTRTAVDGWRGGRGAPPSSSAAAVRAPRTRTAAEEIAETTAKQAVRAAQRARSGAGAGRSGTKRRGARAGAGKARARGGKRAKSRASNVPSIASFFTRRA